MAKLKSTDIFGNLATYGDVIVSGDLSIYGKFNTIDVDTMKVVDKVIELGHVEEGSPTDVTADGGGIILKGATDKTITWVSGADEGWFSNRPFRALELYDAGYRVLTTNSVVVASSVSGGVLKFNGSSKLNGAFYNGSAANPDGIIRLNYDGYFYATKLYGKVGNDMKEVLLDGQGYMIDTDIQTFFNQQLLNADSSSVGAIKYNGKTKSTGVFYGGTTNPSNSLRLNYDGNFHATKLFIAGTEVVGTDTATHNDGVMKGSNTGTKVSYDPFTTKTKGAFYRHSDAPSNSDILKYDGYFYATKLYVGGAEVVNTATHKDGIMKGGNSGTQVSYDPFSAKTKGAFYTAATAPTNSDRLAYDGYFYATKLYAGAAEVLTTSTGVTLLSLENALDEHLDLEGTKIMTGPLKLTSNSQIQYDSVAKAIKFVFN